MPTGYTYRIEEGISFEEFIMGCARAFGACITMRDESYNKPIPEKFEESSYEKTEYKKAVLVLKRLRSMSLEEAEIISTEEYIEEIKSNKKYIEKIERKEKLYEDMLSKVNDWTPPSKEHIGLKDFMIEQINISMDKGRVRDYYTKNKSEKLNTEQWLFNKIKYAQEDINSTMRRWQDETKRTAERNKWIKQLRESIKI